MIPPALLTPQSALIHQLHVCSVHKGSASTSGNGWAKGAWRCSISPSAVSPGESITSSAISSSVTWLFVTV